MDAVFMGTESQFCATIGKFSSLLAFCVHEPPAKRNPTSLYRTKLDQTCLILLLILRRALARGGKGGKRGFPQQSWYPG